MSFATGSFMSLRKAAKLQRQGECSRGGRNPISQRRYHMAMQK